MDWCMAMGSTHHMDKWIPAFLPLIGLANYTKNYTQGEEESIVAPLTVKLILIIGLVGWLALGLVGGFFTNLVLSEIKKISESQATAATLIAKDTAKLDLVIEDQKAQWTCIHELQKPQNGNGK